MKQTNVFIMAGLIVSMIFATGLFAQTAEEIVRQADDIQDYNSAYMEVRMINTTKQGVKNLAYKTWAKDSNFMMEFTGGEEDGQKILRTKKKIYHYFPNSELVYIKGNNDSVFGSSGLISYDDVSDEDDMLDKYNAEIMGRETINGAKCFKIKLLMKPKKRVAYPIQILWIEEGTYTIWRTDMFTRGNKPLKSMLVRKVKMIQGKQVPVDMILTDSVRRGVSSEIFVDVAQLNIDISAGKFKYSELQR